MNESERNVRLVMVRENLNNLPEYELPAGYSVRWYQPGEEKAWLAATRRATMVKAAITRQFNNRRPQSTAGVLAGKGPDTFHNVSTGQWPACKAAG